MIQRGKIIHDTRKIIEADAGALQLFQATRDQLIGRPLIELFDGGPLMIDIEQRRLRSMRENDTQWSDLDFVFKRVGDGGYFYARTLTLKIGDVWETTLDYEYDTHAPYD